MVLKNVTVSKIENVTVIELGNGDVDVSDTTHKETNKVGIMFTNNTPSRIGSKRQAPGQTSDEMGLDAIITFTKIESIEVVQRALEEAKEGLAGILNRDKQVGNSA